jgi:hippurate hydrolase
MPAGHFGMRAGGIMAASDEFKIVIEGKGGHAALPQNAIDPVVVAAQVILALQTIVSRNVDPMREAVLSITMVEAGTAFNIIPSHVQLTGTVRTLDEEVRGFVERRLSEIAQGVAGAFGAKAQVRYRRGYPVTVNAERPVSLAGTVAMEVAGRDHVDVNVDAMMGGEDFAYMLQARPGAYVFIGNGDSSQLHTDTYDFNDEIIPTGVSYWVKLVETALAETS